MQHSSRPVVPVTIRLKQHLDHRPVLLFSAYADIDQRAHWSVPPEEIVSFESHDFRVGGADHFVRGPRENPKLAGTTRYEHIVENERIVFTERLVNSELQLEWISLITWTMTPVETGALVAITDQTTSVVGSGPIEGRKYSYTRMLDRLSQHLAERVH